MGGGAAKQANAFAFEVLQGFDPRARHHGQILFVATGRCTQQAGVQAIGFADDGGQITKVGEVHLTVGERFIDNGASAFEIFPVDGHALISEGFFQQLLAAQHVADAATAVLATGTQVGHGNADLGERISVRQQGQAAQHTHQCGGSKAA